MQWTAIVLAGQRPGVDPLAAHFGLQLKPLVPLAGEAMLTHVLRALHASPEIGEIIVLGQQPAELADAAGAGGGAEIRCSEDGISASIATQLKDNPKWPVLVTTADHPLLTPAMIAEFCAKARSDLSVAMVARSNMLARFPDAQRTWLKFSDDGWSGANLFAFFNANVLPALDLWSSVEQNRKNAIRLFARFGPWLALRALTRTISMGDALAKAGLQIGVEAHLVAMSDPVAAIDVDKLADHQQATQLIARRR